MPPSHGERRRREILTLAVDLASADGLEGLSIGRLAGESRMSKSGLFAHFGSKQDLQLSTIRFAAEGYERDVIGPAEAADAGLPRLRALLENWLGYIEGTQNRGGCFFHAASSEFGSRAGRARDLLARLSLSWIRRLEEQAHIARRFGELRAVVDPELLAFQLHAFVQEANWARELLGDADAFEKARRATAETLRAAAKSPRRRGASR